MSKSDINVPEPYATTLIPGIVELATDAETQLLADTTKVLTPSNMGALFAPEKQSGFQEWTGAGSYYTINTTDFVLDRPGIGWINTVRVTWAGGQTVASLAAGSTHFIYIDDTGTIGSTTTRSTSLYQDNIVLFEVLVDSDTPANVVVVKENHSLMTHPLLMNSLHDLGMHGYDTAAPTGGTIALNGTVGLQVNGDISWHDHDLETIIPDSAAAAITMNIMYTNGAGKWVILASQNTLPTQYNNAGTPTALAGNQRSIYSIYVSKDDIESVNPQYFAIMNSSKFANLSLANAAVASTSFSVPTNELSEIELIRMGVVIINATQIDSVTVSKQTIGTGNISSVGGEANLIDVSTTNFDGWLSAADTTVQASLETLDDIGKIIVIDATTSARTLPFNPCFQARNTTVDTNVTGDGTTVTVEFDGEIFDQNADYDNTTDTFTAPVTGKYLLTTSCITSGWDGTQTSANIAIVTTARTYYGAVYPGSTGDRSMSLTVIADMSATDTAYVQITVSGGNKVISINGGTDTHFFGNLIS